MCKLSIIVPVYNMASDGKLEYCINSLLNQTISNYEIITVDDKSTDNSLEILHRYEREYPDRIRVIESEKNGRQGAARNKGIKIARGEYIGFMDADDWVLPDTYESAIKKAEETGADVVGFDMCMVYEHTMTITDHIECNTLDQTGILDQKKRALLLLKPGPFSTKIYKKEFFTNPPFLFTENIAYEDNAAVVEVIMRIQHFEHIPEVKCFYYQHSDSTTHYMNQKNIDDRITSMRIALESAKKRKVLTEFHDELEFLYAKLFYATTLFSYMQSDIKQKISFVRSLGKEIKTEFPEFMNNANFINTLDDEQKKWIKLQQKSTFIFFVYYKLTKFYRLKRYGKW